MIGSKFITDPYFRIFVNNKIVELSSLKDLVGTRTIPIKDIGNVILHCIDTQKTGRTSKQNGVAWWVNKRLVGEPSWKGFDEDAIDARTIEAKRYTFVVEADILEGDVKEDWSDFNDTSQSEATKSVIRESILLLV